MKILEFAKKFGAILLIALFAGVILVVLLSVSLKIVCPLVILVGTIALLWEAMGKNRKTYLAIAAILAAVLVWTQRPEYLAKMRAMAPSISWPKAPNSAEFVTFRANEQVATGIPAMKGDLIEFRKVQGSFMFANTSSANPFIITAGQRRTFRSDLNGQLIITGQKAGQVEVKVHSVSGR